MTIPSIMSEPTFLRNMYESFTSALQKDDSSFSMREFVKEYLEIQSPEALTAAKIIPLIQKRMLNERPHYEPIFHALFPNTIGFKLVSEKLLTFAESLRRTGYQETEVQFFQKYAFQFAILSIWNQSKKFSDQDCLRKSFEQFEALRTYRQDLSQILQVESSQIVNLMKKVLPRHFSSSDVQAQAEALQQQIQNFFNENLHKEKEDRIFPVKGLGLMIGAHMENKLGELICYRAERSAGIASHLLLSREGKSPVFNACRVIAVETDPTKELEQRNTLSQIPGIDEIITPAPAVYRTGSGFLLRSPLNWDILHNQIELDPFIFSGIELIEISKQILQAVQKLTEHHYIHSSLGLEHIAVRKTEAGIEARLGDPEQIIPLSNWGKEIGHSSAYYAFNQGKKQISQEIVLNEFSIFLAKTLLGIDDLHKDPLQQLFQQVEEVVSPENYEQILFLKKQSDRYGESYVHNLKNYVKRLRSDDGDIFSISALEQFIEKNLILSCIYPFISDSTSSPSAILPTETSPKLSFEEVHLRLEQAKNLLEEIYIEKGTTEVAGVSKGHLYQFLAPLGTKEQVDVFHEIFSGWFQEHHQIGSDIRFHKGDLWKEREIPFSFRVQVEKRKIVLTLFPVSDEKKSYAGAKPAWQMEIFPHGATGLIPIEVIRDDKYEVAKERRDVLARAREILKVPGALRYFAYPPKQQLSYEGSKKGRKWEMYSERYKERLPDLEIEDQIDVLFHVLQGIKLISQKGLVHGEIHVDNVGVYRIDGGYARARFLWKTDPMIQNPLHYDNLRKNGELTLSSDIYGFVRLLAETLLPDLQHVNWEGNDLDEIKEILQKKRMNRVSELRVRIEAQIEDLILPLLKKIAMADFQEQMFPTIQEVENVLLNCFEILEEPFPYLHPVFTVEPVAAEPGEQKHDR